MNEINKILYSLRDEKYKAFQSKLLPTVDKECIIGVRMPLLKALSKKLSKETRDAFLRELPHKYYDENNLHVYIIADIKEPDECFDALEKFLPYVDNWATCDSLLPKAIEKDKARLLERIDIWLNSNRTYMVRFAVGMLMRHFLEEDYKPEYPEKVASIASEEYYVNMMCAWYFATALAYQYEAILPFFEEGRLPIWVHNKAITKARESFRVPKEHKDYLKTLKRKTTD